MWRTCGNHVSSTNLVTQPSGPLFQARKNRARKQCHVGSMKGDKGGGFTQVRGGGGMANGTGNGGRVGLCQGKGMCVTFVTKRSDVTLC